MAHAQNQQTIADGQITLYQRDDVKDARWQCRIRIKGHSGYVRRSTGQIDFDRAREASLQILGELNQRAAQSLPLRKKTFAEIAASFLRGGSDCLDSSPRVLSGSLPGFAERGVFRFCRGVGRA